VQGTRKGCPYRPRPGIASEGDSTVDWGRSKEATVDAFQPAACIDLVRRTVLEALAGEDVAVLFFGSRARGNARRASDIDVALAPRQALKAGVLARLHEQLEDLRIPYTVDLVLLNQVSATFRDQVMMEGIRWRS
jgi:predicted nucleotidyltransferase